MYFHDEELINRVTHFLREQIARECDDIKIKRKKILF